MSKKGKLGILGALLTGSLAFGTEAYAQNPRANEQLNRIYSRNSEYSASGEGVLLKDFVYDLPDSTVNIGQWLGLYAQRGNLSYDVVDTRKGLENTLSYLRNGTQTPEKRASINYIQRLSQTISETDNASLNALGAAVSDGVIRPQEMVGVKPNTYMIIARSAAGQGYSSQSVPILVNVSAKQRATEQRPSPIPYVPPVTREPQRQDTSRVPVVREPVRVPEQPKNSEHRRRKPSVRLTLDGIMGENKMVGAQIGLGYGPIGLSVNYTQNGDRTVREVITPLSSPLLNERYGVGREREIDFKSIGVSAEIHPLGPFFLGAGANFGDFTRRIEESIISSEEDTLATNVNSRSETQHSNRVYAGLEFPNKGSFALRGFGGYDTKKGFFGGAGISLRLNRRQHR